MLTKWFKFLFKKSAQIFMVCALMFSAVVGNAAELKPLSEQSLIRVYISDAPGMGHQSASTVVMRRLRQLGFAGQFEVVYADATAEKLKTLLPGFQPQESSWQTLEGLGIKAIAESQYKNINTLPEVEIAISGADDNRKNMNPEKMFAKNYILLEPLGWGQSYHMQKDGAVKTIPGLGGLGFKYDIDDSKRALDKEFATMMSIPEQAEKVEGLKAMMSVPAEMGAIYGVGLIPNFAEKIKIWVQGLQMAERSTKFSKPLILPIISPLNDFEMKILKWELGMLEKAQPGSSPKKIRLLDIKDGSLSETIKSLGAGDVLLVQTGRLPQPVFESIFKRSTVPVLVAGKNAMNLAQNLGKVYVNTVNDYGFEMGKDPASEKIIRDAFDTFNGSKSFDKYIRQLSKFVQASMNKESALSQYFYKLGPQDRDKVGEALKFAGVPRIPSMGGLSCRAIFQ